MSEYKVTGADVEIHSTIMVILFWNLLMFDQIFLSPQVKRSLITSTKHGLYELPHELPNELNFTHGIFADGRAWAPTQEKIS